MISKLTPIKDRLPDYIEYNQIRVVIAGLVQKYGQVMSPTGDLVLEDPYSQVKKTGTPRETTQLLLNTYMCILQDT